jgi:hypothetical protein
LTTGPSGSAPCFRSTASAIDFSQRYVGTFSDDGRTIEGTWEISHDGTTWEKDFDLTYRKR